MPDEPAVQLRIAVVVREGLPVWQRLNLVAFLASGIASAHPEALGEPYRDARGRVFPRMFAQPVMVFEATGPNLAEIVLRALESALEVMVFPERLFETGNDTDNRAAFAALPPDDLRPAGAALYGGRNRISKLLIRARKHP